MGMILKQNTNLKNNNQQKSISQSPKSLHKYQKYEDANSKLRLNETLLQNSINFYNINDDGNPFDMNQDESFNKMADNTSRYQNRIEISPRERQIIINQNNSKR